MTVLKRTESKKTIQTTAPKQDTKQVMRLKIVSEPKINNTTVAKQQEEVKPIVKEEAKQTTEASETLKKFKKLKIDVDKKLHDYEEKKNLTPRNKKQIY